jgi:hypothetical protein
VARMWKKTASIVMIIALIITLLPIGWHNEADAATSAFRFDNYSTSPGAPTESPTKSITLSGTYSGIQRDSITYKVEQITLKSDGTYAVQSSTNSSTIPVTTTTAFTFVNVELFEGLNRITLKGRADNTSSEITAEAYVVFGNAPVVSEVRTADNRLLKDGEPLIVGPNDRSITIMATNAITVTVNGTPAFSGGGDFYIASNLALEPGYNELAIVADSGSKRYSVNRQLIYFDEVHNPTAHSIIAGASQKLDGNPVVTSIAAGLKGKLLYKLPDDGSTPSIPVIKIDVKRYGVPVTLPSPTPSQSNLDGTIVGTGIKSGQWITYDFTVTTAALSTDGEYVFTIRSHWNGQDTVYDIPVRLRALDTPYITEIKQLYDVNETATPKTYGTNTIFSAAPKQVIYRLPIWIQVDAKNYDFTDAIFTNALTARDSNGNVIGTSAFQATPTTVTDPYTNATAIAYKITKMPADDITLEFKVSKNANFDLMTRKIQYLPVPSIQVDSVTNGMPPFTTSTGLINAGITGQLINFELPANPADPGPTITMTMNGKSINIVANSTTGRFTTVGNTAFNDVLTLVNGPNVLELRGTAAGIPVSTRYTFFHFTDNLPSVTVTDVVPAGENNDLSDVYKKTSERNYTTTRRDVDILFTFGNVPTTIVIEQDGAPFARATYSTASSSWSVTEGAAVLDITGPNWRIKGKLPESGTRSWAIKAVKGVNSISESVTITREYPAYELLSPMLPNERIINQNFLPISIRSEGAKRIELGKQDMIEGKDDIFRLDYTGLKPGVNKIKFTIYQGDNEETEIEGEFSVTYAADNTVGAQYKTTLSKSGKISVFNGAVQLSFPKNTFLKQPGTELEGSDRKIDLFDSQNILFGIADKQDGRTQKYYNRVGEQDGTVWKDGVIERVVGNPMAEQRLKPLMHFANASQLYWIDAGYITGDRTTDLGFKFIEPSHPYRVSGTDYTYFYLRGPQRWLEPSQSGEISIAYDASLRNVAANNLAVWRFDGNNWTNLGGIVDTKKRVVTAKFDGFGYYAVRLLSYSYDDIVGHDFARTSMELLLARGIMNAKNENEFGALDNITRGEFAQMLVKMANIPLNYDNDASKLTFTDVPPISFQNAMWDYKYIETAARAGIVRGMSPRLFLPNQPLTREEAAVMISRATNLLKGSENAEKDKATLVKQFTDGSLIDIYNASAVLAVTKAGYITGRANTVVGNSKPTVRFDPRSNLNRAEAAVMTERVMKKAKLL